MSAVYKVFTTEIERAVIRYMKQGPTRFNRLCTHLMINYNTDADAASLVIMRMIDQGVLLAAFDLKNNKITLGLVGSKSCVF